MQHYKKMEKAIKRKFINPLKYGCEVNIHELNQDKKVKHHETVNLLTQAYNTLDNVEYNLKQLNLVDANTLLRSAFENLMMGMMIEFDENVFNEFKDLSTDDKSRDHTKLIKIRSKFRTHLNEISEPFFKNLNRDEKLDMLNGIYDKLCLFTHSTLIVSTMMELKKSKEKEAMVCLMNFNFYFIKLLLFLCLKYFTHDEEHYIESSNLYYTYILYLFYSLEKLKECENLTEIFNKFLYRDQNQEYFDKSVIGLKEGLEDLVEDFKDEDFKIGLQKFLE